MLQKCRIIKEWAGFRVGQEIPIGEPKASDLKMRGFVEFIGKPVKEKPKPVETASLNPKANADAKAKAKAEAEEKAEAEKKAEADTKAKAKTDAKAKADADKKAKADAKR